MLRQDVEKANCSAKGNGDSASPNNPFHDKDVRRRFISKVFVILSLQLMVTFAFVAVSVLIPAYRKWVQSQPYLGLTAFIVSVVVLFAMVCCEGPRRKSPLNYICLAVFTIAEGFVLGVAAASYDPDSVLTAVAATVFVCLGMTVFAMQTSVDFTVYRGLALILLIVLLVYGVVLIFWHKKVAYLVYSALGTLIFSFYLLMDVQKILGGGRYVISTEDYVYACLTLYLDIINIFIHILALVGNR